MKISLEQLVNTNYIKYFRMKDIINYIYSGFDASTLNIYIDMYSIVKPLYSHKNYDINDYSALTACIINMCAHYRDFFRSRYNTESKIFIIYSKNCNYINNQFYPEYNCKNFKMFNANKKVDSMVINNIELLSTLCPYLPDIYFIPGTFETGVIIYDLIQRNQAIDNSPHMVITKDPYNYQLVPMSNNVVIIRPKKVNGYDISYYIDNSNLIQSYLSDRKIKNRNDYGLSSGLLSLIMSLSSVPERNIKSLFNIPSALKLINNSVKDYKLLNGYNSSTEHIWNAIDNGVLKIGYPTFENRFKAVDIATQHWIFLNSPESKIELKNLYDAETIKTINNKYFRTTPLDLNRL